MPISLPIETERLILRPFEPERDADQMLEVYGDPAVMRFVPDGTYGELERLSMRRTCGRRGSPSASAWPQSKPSSA